MEDSDGGHFFCNGKYFESFDEMIEFDKKWPEMPFDFEWFQDFMKTIQEEVWTYMQIDPNLTNRMAYKMIRSRTDWVMTEQEIREFYKRCMS